MLLIHKPVDGEEERHDLDTLSALEAGLAERELDCTWEQVETDMRNGSALALLAALWLFRKRTSPGLKRTHVDVANFRKTLYVRLSTDEVVTLVDNIRENLPEDEAERKEVLDALRELAADREDVDLAVEAGPKD
jgi:hypothetical protein